ncbi:MAG: immune inhibitor A, partial [Caldilineaceae bacterium]|nr:immune inhibitor A [Caldilineaceae bacterium]
LTRQFDLTAVQPGDSIEMEIAMWFNIETDYDYGYVVVSSDGEKWTILPGQQTTTDNPSGNSFGDAYTDVSRGSGGAPVWITESFDLSEYAGEEIYVRLEYVTDEAVNEPGWFVDDVRIDAIDYAADFEDGPDGWESEGWLLTNGQLTQGWLVQVLELENNILSAVRRPEVDANGHATIDVTGLGGGKTAVLAISGLAPVTTETANYSFEIETR